MLPHNILFLLIDGLRADKCHGENKTSSTPNIDSLIKKGIYFTQSISCADGTFVSLNSIFNAVYPFRIGVRAKKLILLDNNFFKIFQNEGYHIYGIIPQLTSFSALIDYLENANTTFNGEPPAEHLFDGLGEKIIRLLSSKMIEPWICYVHILDLHSPLMVPENFDHEQYGYSKYERILSSIDFWIGRIIEKIDIKNTLVVITGDHGAPIPVSNKDITAFEPSLTNEIKIGKKLIPSSVQPIATKLLLLYKDIVRMIKVKLNDRNLTQYEKRSRLPYFTLSLYDELIHVPLIFTGCNIKPTFVNKQVCSIDIFPTITDIVEINRKHDAIDGNSLIPAITNSQFEEKSIYLHTMPYEKISSHDLVGIRTSNYKYFRSSHDPKKNIHLYNLINDPQENKNIAKIQPELVDNFEKQIVKITSNIIKVNVQETDDEETAKIKDELKKLGYL